MLNREKGIPQSENKTDTCLTTLGDEIQQAVSWERPSILLAVHQSKNDQDWAILAMEEKLKTLQLNVINIMPEGKAINLQEAIIQKLNSNRSIFFVRGLGSHLQTYHGLNMDRELIVEQCVKIIFWLSVDEMILLSHHAPDFWAYRHRVVEFPTRRSSPKNNLPSGVLLWHLQPAPMELDMLRKKIFSQEKFLHTIPLQGETIINHAQAVGNLTYYYWLAGENQKVAALLHEEIKHVSYFDLKDVLSQLLNMQAINCFDLDEFPEALRWVDQALKLNPNQDFLWSNHGVICRSAGQGRKALASLTRAIKLNPVSFENWGVLGYSYMSLGKYSSALPCFHKAIGLRPESVRFYPAIAICHSRMGNAKEFHEIIQRLSAYAVENEYLSVCRDGLVENVSAAISRLKKLVFEEKVSKAFLRRDPNFRFIFGLDTIQSAV